MQTLKDFWQGFRVLPSAWLLLVQLFILILSSLTNDSHLSYRAISWVLGVLALLIIAKVIRQSPAFSALGLLFVSGALLFSVLILLGYREPFIQIMAHGFESLAYFYAAYGLLRYMFADRYLTKDELFAAGAVFTLLAWGFAFLYNICQLIVPTSFIKPDHTGLKSWLDLLFLSFSLQSATGLSDIIPSGAAARVIAIIQMFGGVMYLAVIVSRLIALQYIRHIPKQSEHKDQ
ncbi:two pore domain potassium channel family protein [Acinetobacter guerrae]|uniref:Two pore domain potassium channel family protein n=1 Tax=Acinetobacter guerrae TaxID=1843371 RepID=A0A3A8F0D5_9GAMM|nr:ion channel [Acinetobacter guerrae]MPW45530.1 ion channel [Acinetobacter guerrae]RKG34153.1 two pore domain potassium channel family protein [Acinetobacter guerrae]